MEGRRVHRRNLLAELENTVLPIALRIEPREREWKRRIVPAPCDPRAIVNEAKRAKRFDQRDLAAIEIVEVLITFHQSRELHLHVTPFPGQQHPEIRNRWTHPRVVEVDAMRTINRPQ